LVGGLFGYFKPGLYREPGSDDGLKGAVLDAYSEMVSKRRCDILACDQPFGDVFETLITPTVQDRRTAGVPELACYLLCVHEVRSLIISLIGQSPYILP